MDIFMPEDILWLRVGRDGCDYTDIAVLRATRFAIIADAASVSCLQLWTAHRDKCTNSVGTPATSPAAPSPTRMKNAMKPVLRVASAHQGCTRMKEGTVCPRPSAPVTTMVSSSSPQTSSQTITPCGKCRQTGGLRTVMATLVAGLKGKWFFKFLISRMGKLRPQRK